LKKQKALEKESGQKVFLISAAAHTGLEDVLRQLVSYVRPKNIEDKKQEDVSAVQKTWSPLD